MLTSSCARFGLFVQIAVCPDRVWANMFICPDREWTNSPVCLLIVLQLVVKSLSASLSPIGGLRPLRILLCAIANFITCSGWTLSCDIFVLSIEVQWSVYLDPSSCPWPVLGLVYFRQTTPFVSALPFHCYLGVPKTTRNNFSTPSCLFTIQLLWGYNID